MFDAKLTPYTIAEYCAAIKRREVKVNYDYQRSAKVWPDAAKSFLIETLLLGYPMPKISLYQITDVKTRKTLKEIVDGQQRSNTIVEFYDSKLRLSKNALPAEAAGRTYEELDEGLQHRFLDYALSVDLFIGATRDDIREVFRRMNSYTVPLNAEERRHARFQGEFKWFIYRLAKRYAQTLENVGTFTEKQLNRMQDAKLLSEIVHAILFGISTTNDRILNKLYSDFEKTFPAAGGIESRISKAIDVLLEFDQLHNGPLMKPYQVYSLLLAVSHFQQPIDKLTGAYSVGKKKTISSAAPANLGRLAAAIDDPDTDPDLEDFVEAGAEKTNVAAQRQTRFVWYCQALDDKLP